MSRPSPHEYFMGICAAVSVRGTCSRRKVGCVIVNELGHIIGTGFNGPASGLPHCIDSPCPGARFASGEGLSECQAIHAECNALMQCKNVHEIFTMYVTTKPCVNCFKMIMSTSCKRVIYRDDYPSDETEKLAELAQIKLVQLK